MGEIQIMKFEVIVSLKPDVLDPQGRAICETLQRLGFAQLKNLQVAKRFVLEVNGDAGEASALVEKIASEYLANPVAEQFSIVRLN